MAQNEAALPSALSPCTHKENKESKKVVSVHVTVTFFIVHCFSLWNSSRFEIHEKL